MLISLFIKLNQSSITLNLSLLGGWFLAALHYYNSFTASLVESKAGFFLSCSIIIILLTDKLSSSRMPTSVLALFQGFAVKNLISLVSPNDFVFLGLTSYKSINDLLTISVVALNLVPALNTPLLNYSFNCFYFRDFPAPLSLCSITIFLAFFKIDFVGPTAMIYLLSASYLLLTINIIGKVAARGHLNSVELFFITVNLINLVVLLLIWKITPVPLEPSTISALSYGLIFNKHPDGTGGIQGFLNKYVFFNEFGALADQFLAVCPETAELIDVSHTKTKIVLDEKLIPIVYPYLSPK